MVLSYLYYTGFKKIGLLNPWQTKSNMLQRVEVYSGTLCIWISKYS